MHLNNKLMSSKSKGILITSPKIAIGGCSSCPGGEGALPAPWQLSAGQGTVPSSPHWVRLTALTPLAAGGEGKGAASTGCSRLGAAQAGAQCGGTGWVLLCRWRHGPGCLPVLRGHRAELLSCVPGKATLAKLPAVGQPRGPRGHVVMGVSAGVRFPAPPAPQCNGHGAGDGHSGWEGFGVEAGLLLHSCAHPPRTRPGTQTTKRSPYVI